MAWHGQRPYLSHPNLILKEPAFCTPLIRWFSCWDAGHTFLGDIFLRDGPGTTSLRKLLNLTRDMCNFISVGKEMHSEFRWIHLCANLWFPNFYINWRGGGGPAGVLTPSGFNLFLIHKWTISLFFVEGPEPEVFPSETKNYYIIKWISFIQQTLSFIAIYL